MATPRPPDGVVVSARRRRRGVSGRRCLALLLGACAASVVVGLARPQAPCFSPPARRSGELRPCPGEASCGAGRPPRPPQPELPYVLGRALVGVAAILVLASPFAAPSAVSANAVAPPTCVSILDALTNCPARQPVGAIENARGQLKIAEERLAEAEKAAGHALQPGESPNGEPEFVDYWRSELTRLDMNKLFLQGLRSRIDGGSTASQPPVRLLSRLTIRAVDVNQEARFWCEACGMQVYERLPGGGARVGFGPPGLKAGGDEGGYFTVEILPGAVGSSSGSTDAQPTAPLGGARLSFVQIATPSLIRISKVIANGGELIDGYGYYGIKSPSGVLIRAYVDDRRDPFEFVALAADEGDGAKQLAKQLQALGLKDRGPYKLVNPGTQAWMPKLPEGNTLYGGSEDGSQVAQVLLMPVPKAKQEPWFALPRGPALVRDENGKDSIDLLEQEEAAETPVSDVRGAGLLVIAADASLASVAPPPPAASTVNFDLQLTGVAAAS